MDEDDADPASPDAREVGRQVLEEGGGIGSVVAHLYRGEVDREVNWRQRLDSTTNWAVTVIAGILAYAFSRETVSHAILLVAMGIGVVFLIVEARRFQRYDVWRARVRTMQVNLFAVVLDPEKGVERDDWRRQLGDAYRNPTIQIPFRHALAHRLRRVYLPLLVGLLAVWLLRLSGASEAFVPAASVAGAPGWAVLAAVGVSYGVLALVAFWPGAEQVSELDPETDRGDLRSEE